MQTLTLGGVLLGLTLSGVRAAGSDEPSPVVLEWETPPGSDCPGRGRVLEDIHRLVGPAPPSTGRVAARAVVRRTLAGRWQMQLATEVGGVKGQRSFDESSCAAIADAAVIILALTVNPDARVAAAAPPLASSLALPLASSAAPAPPAPPPPPTDAPLEARPAWSLFAGATADIGTLPHPSLGVGAGVRRAWGPARLGLYGAYWPLRSATVGQGARGDLGGHFSLLILGVEGCVDLLSPRALSLALCAGPEVDDVRGSGFGVSSPGEGSAVWPALAARSTVAVPLGASFAATGGLGLVIADRAHPFVLEGIRPQVYEAGKVGARGWVGLGLSFLWTDAPPAGHSKAGCIRWQ